MGFEMGLTFLRRSLSDRPVGSEYRHHRQCVDDSTMTSLIAKVLSVTVAKQSPFP
jgi:hypothetical protein